MYQLSSKVRPWLVLVLAGSHLLSGVLPDAGCPHGRNPCRRERSRLINLCKTRGEYSRTCWTANLTRWITRELRDRNHAFPELASSVQFVRKTNVSAPNKTMNYRKEPRSFSAKTISLNKPIPKYPLLKNTQQLVYVDFPSKLILMWTPKGGATAAAQAWLYLTGTNDREGVSKFSRSNSNTARLIKSGINWEISYVRWLMRKRNHGKSVDINRSCERFCADRSWSCVKIIRSPFDRAVSSFLRHLKIPSGSPQQLPALRRGGSFASFLQALPSSEHGRVERSDHYLPAYNSVCDSSSQRRNILYIPLECLADALRSSHVSGDRRENFANLSLRRSAHYLSYSDKVFDARAAYINYTDFVSSGVIPARESFLALEETRRKISELFAQDIDLYRHACRQRTMVNVTSCKAACDEFETLSIDTT